MKQFLRGVGCAAVLGLSLSILASPSSLAQTAKKLQPPVLVTSAGQALDAFTVKTLLGRASVNANYDAKATAAALDNVKTVIIAVGASNKGFGQAGITAETETARTKAILDTAKTKGIPVVCVHIGGAERRKGLSVQFVEQVCPAADYIVVSKDGNADNYFDGIAKDKSIPLTIIDQSLDVGKAIAALIAKS